MNNLLRRKKGTPPYKRVRIAVLDTGLRETSPHWSRIQHYEDFVSKGNTKGVDKTGHGTNSVHLIFKIIADAHIYVARVFENEKSNKDTISFIIDVCILSIGLFVSNIANFLCRQLN